MKDVVPFARITRCFGTLVLPLWILIAFPYPAQAEKQRVFVLTDISNEPDDEESMVRFLVYANEYDIEGLVATTSTHLRNRTREDLIRRQIDAYRQVRGNLIVHADEYPTSEQLLAVTVTGQTSYGMEAVGDGKSTAGSKLLLAAADKDDNRPLWISVWGGANTLAQALLDARRDRSPEELSQLVAKLRVYTISDQDDAGRWLRTEFPGLFYIVSPSSTDWREYYRATWTGISGDRHYKNGPFVDFDLVDNPWLEANVIENHGPLGALYPKLEYIMEGDTPSFLGLIENGLGWSASPAYGGWGGRYVLYQSYAETHPIWTDNLYNRDTIAVNGKPHTSNQASIWRWRKHYQHDFAARMDWCVTDDLKAANHNPIAVLNGDRSKAIVQVSAKPGEVVSFSSTGSSDPDGDAFTCTWMVYREAGTHSGDFELTRNAGVKTKLAIADVGSRSQAESTVHVILTVEDNGTPSSRRLSAGDRYDSAVSATKHFECEERAMTFGNRQFARWCALLGTIGCVTATLYGQQRSDHLGSANNDGFVVLFDGKTLDGWHAVPEDCASDWCVEDGVIVGRGSADRLAYLVWKDEQLTDFVLRLRYRLPGKGNTGVEIRSQVDRSGKRPFEGYHADLGHVGIGPHILGAWDFHFAHRKEFPCPRGTQLMIDKEGKPRSSPIFDSLTAADVRPHQWNDVRIVARGSHFQFFINSKLASEFTDHSEVGRLDHGAIGLQIHDKGMRVEFADIRLKRLAASDNCPESPTEPHAAATK